MEDSEEGGESEVENMVMRILKGVWAFSSYPYCLLTEDGIFIGNQLTF